MSDKLTKAQNTIYQHTFRAKMKERGFRQMAFWVHQDDEEEVRRLANELRARRG